MGRKPIPAEDRRVPLYVGLPMRLFRQMREDIDPEVYLRRGIMLDTFLRDNNFSSVEELMARLDKQHLSIDLYSRNLHLLQKVLDQLAEKHPELREEVIGLMNANEIEDGFRPLAYAKNI